MSLPAWLQALLALLTGALLSLFLPSPPPLDVAAFRAASAATLDPRTMTVRDLRRLPGIGEKRALAVARARRLHDPRQGELRWSGVSGIGVRTEERIVSWLAAHGGDPNVPLVEARHPRMVAMRAPRSWAGFLPLAALFMAACTAEEGHAAAATAAEAGVGITSRKLSVGDARIRIRVAGHVSPRAVLLLHGAAFTSQTWVDLGTVERLAGAGHRVVAVDLPGHGESTQATATPAGFLLALLDALEIERAVIVSPSMSGCFSLPFLVQHPERVAGYVPVAPACLDQVEGTVSVPTLVLWGQNDAVLPPEKARAVVALVPAAEVVILPDARHPCYLDQPERFHELLSAFVTRTLDG